MSRVNLNKYRSYKDNNLLKNWEPEILTPLPLPGEYVVLQLNPAAMAKHVGNSKLIKELSKLETKKYVAICAGYYEALSDLKPWHMMHALLVYGEGEEAEEDENPPAQDFTDASAGETGTPPRSTGLSNSAGATKRTRKTRLLQNICIRIHTRLCDLPRTKPVQMPVDTFSKVRSHIVTTYESDYDQMREPRVPIRDLTLVCAPKPATQDVVSPLSEDKYDSTEWSTASKELQFCLLPHCDYSFDLMQGVYPGSQFMDEHAHIISMMRSAIPEMPLKARLPGFHHSPKPQEYYVEEPPQQIWFDVGLTEAPDYVRAKSERARWRAMEYNRRQTFFQRFFQPERRYWPTKEVAELQKQSEGIEIPDLELLVYAPPAVLDVEASRRRKLSWRAWLAQLWIDIRVNLARTFWIPPDYLEPLDDLPYIPFAKWDELSKKGDIKRWRGLDDRNFNDDLSPSINRWWD
ncbi:hypothetical protein BDY19DRAFT_955518 [Irpex rosettiformis]|uniref:Uncharacterized protein n=1 Tax=Irpex rosettiformis TaxID=378272 RepID=A0ACB8TZ69_9APHY|nr:hypothetical protein BDY19DRAFT_955518 [Irpex rosettiformis]